MRRLRLPFAFRQHEKIFFYFTLRSQLILLVGQCQEKRCLKTVSACVFEHSQLQCTSPHLGEIAIVLEMFVCVEVLRSSQPYGVMSIAVSLPNHTFTGQA